MRSAVFAGAVAIAGLFGALLATPAFGDSSGVVSATVTAGAPCLTVNSTAVVFPTKKFSTSIGNSVSAIASGPTVTNCSGLQANILGSATNATGPSNTPTWAITPVPLPQIVCAPLGALLTNNKFALGLRFASDDEPTLSTSGVALRTLAINASLPSYEMELFMPCTTSDGAGTTMSFQITYTASLP